MRTPQWLALFGRTELPPKADEWVALPYDPSTASRAPRDLPGFAETAAQFPDAVARASPAAAGPAGDPPPRRPQQEPGLPFPSTGPHGHRQRMREKLLQRGADALADYELLEMLLFLVQPKGDTKPLAKRIINAFGSFGAVLAAPQRDLLAVPGLGDHSVAALKLVQASAIRLARSDVQAAPLLSNWDVLIAYLNALQGRDRIEQFRVLFLDTRNRLLADEAQARGTVNHTPVYPREIARRALELHATALILVHNHPSGDPSPSRADIDMTQDIIAALNPIDVAVHDHIIIANGNWLSFRQRGLMNR